MGMFYIYTVVFVVHVCVYPFCAFQVYNCICMYIGFDNLSPVGLSRNFLSSGSPRRPSNFISELFIFAPNTFSILMWFLTSFHIQIENFQGKGKIVRKEFGITMLFRTYIIFWLNQIKYTVYLILDCQFITRKLFHWGFCIAAATGCLSNDIFLSVFVKSLRTYMK